MEAFPPDPEFAFQFQDTFLVARTIAAAESLANRFCSLRTS
jgi:hypothetical protein